MKTGFTRNEAAMEGSAMTIWPYVPYPYRGRSQNFDDWLVNPEGTYYLKREHFTSEEVVGIEGCDGPGFYYVAYQMHGDRGPIMSRSQSSFEALAKDNQLTILYAH